MHPSCKHRYFKSRYGPKLHYWSLGVENPKGIVVFQHGLLSQASGAYVTSKGKKLNGALVQDFCQKQGYAVYAMDLYGHGFSEGSRAYIPSYQQYRDDLSDFCAKVVVPDCQNNDENNPLPLFVLAYSFGGTVTLHTAKYWQDHPEEAPKGFAGVAVLAPPIVGDIPPWPILYLLTHVIARLFPYTVPTYLPNYGEPPMLWRDEEARSLHMYPDKFKWGIDNGGNQASFGTAAQVMLAMVAFQKMIPEFNVPFCAVHGLPDKSSYVDGTKLLESQCKTPESDRCVLYLPEARHDILADPDVNEQTMDFIGKFFAERIAKVGKE